MLVAPLLSLLAHAFTHDHHAVVTQSADDGFGDAAARGQLAHARLVGDGVDDVGRCSRTQILGADDADRSRRILQFCLASDARHYYLVQFQMAEEHVRGVIGVVMLRIFHI